MSGSCNKLEFCKNVTEYRVVYDKVYFHTNTNCVMIPDTEMVQVNRSYTGSIDFINNNIYIIIDKIYIIIDKIYIIIDKIYIIIDKIYIIIDFINNIYIDIRMNNYIPIFDKKTGDVLV